MMHNTQKSDKNLEGETKNMSASAASKAGKISGPLTAVISINVVYFFKLNL